MRVRLVVRPARQQYWRLPFAWAQAACRLVGLWRWRVRDRCSLAKLGEREMHDLGLTRADIEREWYKPFWRK
jgi:uncharacterized protein YjiS (DUF1127 family)